MTLNCNSQLLDISSPIVMGILNVTPDSFFDGGRYAQADTVLAQATLMLQEGAQILDIGGASSRPGAVDVSLAEELDRVLPVIELIKKEFPNAILSIDTWRSEVATAALKSGASIVNDIAAGNLDSSMGNVLQTARVPYVLMHMKGQPNTMQTAPQYEDVVTEVLDFFIEKVEWLRSLGVQDIILDPGFGFGKTVEHNYALLRNIQVFGTVLNLPVLAGISRKSMICKPLKINPSSALNGTTALHMVALQQGASILRVHDVREAVEVICLWQLTKE